MDTDKWLEIKYGDTYITHTVRGFKTQAEYISHSGHIDYVTIQCQKFGCKYERLVLKTDFLKNPQSYLKCIRCNSLNLLAFWVITYPIMDQWKVGTHDVVKSFESMHGAALHLHRQKPNRT